MRRKHEEMNTKQPLDLSVKQSNLAKCDQKRQCLFKRLCLLTNTTVDLLSYYQTNFLLTNFNTFVQIGMQEFPNFVTTNIF